MTAWIGLPGSLVRVTGGSQVARTGGLPGSELTSWASGRTQTTTGPNSLRRWTAQAGVASPAERVYLEQVAAGGLVAPLTWYSDEATVGNILTPEDSTLMSWQNPGQPGKSTWTRVGARVFDDGFSVLSMITAPNAPGAITTTDTPVPAGATVTFGAYVGSAGVSVGLIWLDATKTNVGSVYTPNSTKAERVTKTAMAPASAVWARLFCNAPGAPGVGLFTLTLTSAPMPAQIGSGCLAARLVARTTDVLTAWASPHPSNSLASLSYEIREERP